MNRMLRVIIGLVIVLCGNNCFAKQVASLAELGISEQDYCYSTKMGIMLFNGIANKCCVCEGELIEANRDTDNDGNSFIRTDCPPGIACDSSTVYCKGKIEGYKFNYNNAGEIKEFNSLETWQSFCSTSAKNQEDCLDNLNYTKATIDYYDNKNTDAIKNYYNNKNKKADVK